MKFLNGFRRAPYPATSSAGLGSAVLGTSSSGPSVLAMQRISEREAIAPVPVRAERSPPKLVPYAFGPPVLSPWCVEGEPQLLSRGPVAAPRCPFLSSLD